MYGQPQPCVVIAGNGIAASTLACLLRDNGFGVIMLAPRRRRRAGAPILEALPQAAVHLIDQVGLSEALLMSHHSLVNGFGNRYRGMNRVLAGAWIHVDRSDLAHHCLTQARRRGATVIHEPCAKAPSPADHEIRVRLSSTVLHAFAAVDATGRSARWSRPVKKAVPATALLYAGPPTPRPQAGLVIGTDHGWAYRLGTNQSTTVGVVTGSGSNSPTAHRWPRPPNQPALDKRLVDLLELDPVDRFLNAGASTASVQWCHTAARKRQLAIGDAALAMNPVSGQGVRFAISSALAAAAVLRTWSEGQEQLGSDYYRCFVNGVRRRHLAKLHELQTDPEKAPPVAAAILPTDTRLGFTAPSTLQGQNRGGRIVAAECFALPDGGLARWVGGVDVRLLRDAAASRPLFPQLCSALESRGLTEHATRVLVAWALKNEVLQPVETPVSVHSAPEKQATAT